MYIDSPVPHDEAAEFLKGKIVLGKKEFLGLPPSLRARAMAVSKIENLYTVQRIRDLCATVPEGGSWDDAKQSIADEILPYMDGDGDDAFLNFLPPNEQAIAKAESRAELLLRMNVGQSYSAAYTKALDDNDDIFPYRQYLTMGDGNVRASHAALDNLILPSNHPFWDTHTPPWDYNCRCSFAGIMAEEADEIAAQEEADNTPPAQRTMLTEDDLDKLAKTGKIHRGNELVDVRTSHEKKGVKGYEWNPRAMNMPRAEVMTNLDPDLRSEFEAWAKSETVPELGISIWEWMA